MAEFLNPALYLEDLAHVFQDEAAAAGGITIDAELCRTFALGLADAAEKVAALVAYAAADGLVRRLDLPPERPRTPVERQRLARRAVALDPAGRVLSFPAAAACPLAITEGGTAA